MITRTIRQLLHGDDGELPLAEIIEKINRGEPISSYRIYVIRDGDTVFYVGKTTMGIDYRIREHLEGKRSSLYLQELFDDNSPQCLEWQVDMYTVEDCAPIIKSLWPFYVQFDDAGAERAMIKYLRPCMNIMHNDEPSVLPERYNPKRAEREHDRLSNPAEAYISYDEVTP